VVVRGCKVVVTIGTAALIARGCGGGARRRRTVQAPGRAPAVADEPGALGVVPADDHDGVVDGPCRALRHCQNAASVRLEEGPDEERGGEGAPRAEGCLDLGRRRDADRRVDVAPRGDAKVTRGEGGGAGAVGGGVGVGGLAGELGGRLPPPHGGVPPAAAAAAAALENKGGKEGGTVVPVDVPVSTTPCTPGSLRPVPPGATLAPALTRSTARPAARTGRRRLGPR